MPQNWKVGESGNLVDDLRYAVVDQARDGETLTLTEVHFRFRLARADRWYDKTLNREPLREIKLTDFGLDLEVNQSIRLDRRREVQFHAERAELNRDYRRSLRAASRRRNDGIRKLAAGQ